MSQLEAHEVPLHKVFSGDYDFQIPDYQRPYAWEVEQATQLLEDLTEALDGSDGEPYFLGSTVLVKTKDSPSADVIDGQQRLTTLSILLAVLRDVTTSDELRGQIQAMLCEPGNIALGRSAKPRLTLRERDAGFFSSYIQTTGALPDLLALKSDALHTDAQTAVRANAKALHAEIGQWSEDRRLSLLSMLSARTYLVVVSTPSIESAHRIFSVMNARGLDLSAADIFKSDVIGSIHTDRDKYAAKWEDAEEAIGRDDFVELFLHLRVIFSGERARRELLKEFPEQVLSKFLPDEADKFVDDVLAPYADAYEDIRNQTYSASTDASVVNSWFRRLNQFEHSDWRPSALWAVRHHGDDPRWLAEFLRRLERLAASLLIRRVYATPRIQRFVDLTRQLSEGRGLEATALDLDVTERMETLARLHGDLYLATKVRKYVLLRLDEVLADNPGVTYDLPIITVEHVLPQSPKSDSLWMSDFTEEQRASWTHRIGNLVLLNRSKNSQAQNYDFVLKKEKYFSGSKGVAPFALTVGVLQHETWTPDILEQRQAYLLTKLAKAWDLLPERTDPVGGGD